MFWASAGQGHGPNMPYSTTLLKKLSRLGARHRGTVIGEYGAMAE
jgi:hypothetical protein